MIVSVCRYRFSKEYLRITPEIHIVLNCKLTNKVYLCGGCMPHIYNLFLVVANTKDI